jgi:hypothetical protein
MESSSFQTDEDGGLTVTPEIVMDGEGTSTAGFALRAVPQFGMFPQGMQLSVTPTIGMAASPVGSFELSAAPQIGMAGLGVRHKEFSLTATPQIGMLTPDYDRTGNGAYVKAPNPGLSWVQILSTDANAVLTAFHVWTQGSTLLPTGVTATVGGVAMDQLAAWKYTSDSHVFVFGKIGPPTGGQTMSISMSSPAANCYVSANSVSYSGVTSFGTPTNSSATSGSLSQTLADSPMAFHVFVNNGNSVPTAYNRNERWGLFLSGQAPATLIGDSIGDVGDVTFTGTATSAAWGSLAVPLL